MQQQPANRNLLLFFLLTFLLFIGWIQLRQRLWPVQQPAQEDKVARKDEAKKDTKDKEPAPVKLPAPPPVTADNRLLELGGSASTSKFHLHVVLDPRGAGVRSVTLNKFQEADSRGLPVKGETLELVPAASNRQTPAHLLYHFDAHDTRSDRPLDTLGRRIWDVVKHDGKDVRVSETDGKARHEVSFRTEIEGVVLTKTYSLAQGEYHLGLQVTLERPTDLAGKGPPNLAFRYQLTGARGLPVEGKWYTATFRNALIAQEDAKGNIYRDLQELPKISLWQGGNAVSRQDDRFIRYAGVAVQYFASVIVVDNEQSNQQFLRQARPTLETAVARGRVKSTSAGAEQVVLTSEDGKTQETIFIPPELRGEMADLREGQSLAIVYRTLSYDENLKACPRVAESIRTGSAADATHSVWEDDITVRVSTESVVLTPGRKVTHRYLLYNGPVKPSLLGLPERDAAKDVDAALVTRYGETLKLNTLTDYHSPGWMGSFASSIGWTFLVIKATNLMHVVLGWLAYVLPSYGLCIIILTVLVRTLMFPLSRKQALMGLKMQELAPELKELKKKYKDDQQAFAQAQMELFRKQGVNPFGSCWVLLLQMPIFMGLYYALQESIYFRLAPFWPSWIHNLAAPDMMIFWGESIPFLSRPQDYGSSPFYLGPYLNLLPIIAVALMIVQQQMMTPPAADEQQEMQQKMMKWMMIIFGFMFYKVAAGLCIYFIASSLWGFAERKLLPKAKSKVDLDTGPTVAAATGAAALAAGGGEQITTAPRTSSAPTGVTKEPTRKPGRNKRKGGERKPVKEEEPATGLARLRQRLSEWWNDVLEQAKKK